MPVAGLCLAAGGASRLGRPKQLLPWGEATLLQTCVRVLLRAPLSCLTVVLGANAPAAAASLEAFSADERFSTVVNERWAEGMASSLVTGMRSLLDKEDPDEPYLGVMIALGDMPLLEADLLTALIEELRRYGNTAIVAPVYEGRRGHPVLIGRAYWDELLRLGGDRGAAEVLRRHADKLHLLEGTAAVLTDIDTAEQWRALRPQLKWEAEAPAAD